MDKKRKQKEGNGSEPKQRPSYTQVHPPRLFAQKLYLTEARIELDRLNQELSRQVQELAVKLDNLQNHFADSIENERAKLAHELHDGPMQDLYAVAYAIEAMDKENTTSSQLEQIQQEVIRVTQSLRSICYDLRPPSLSASGLVQSITDHVTRFGENNPDVNIRLNLYQGQLQLPQKTRVTLFRIYQVAFTNAVRHSQANQIEICLDLQADKILLKIKDDGVGFQVPGHWDDFRRLGHLGLADAFERAESIGGRMEVHSSTGKGTMIELEVSTTN
jgi:signal transduction histidine kinase